MKNNALLPSVYLGSVQYFSKLLSYPSVMIEHYEHFPKQTYRNRCNIYGANGLLSLSIPLEKRKEKTITKDIRISYENNWQKIHWRSLESSYRCSPFFEYYEDDLAPFYTKKINYLVEFNEAMLELIMRLTGIKKKFLYTTEYHQNYPDTDDFRKSISPKINFEHDTDFTCKPYLQVFENKSGFIPNLSIIDLLFNQGNDSIDFI